MKAQRGASPTTAAPGGTKISGNVAAELGAKSKNSLDFEARFSGKGFEFFKGAPTQPLVIPGATKKVSVWVRSDTKYGWSLLFKDGWGRTEANGQKFEWNIAKGADGTWKKMIFDVPPAWIQPLSIDGVLVHNWESQNQKASAQLSLDQLEVETDIADVDDTTGVLKTWKPAAPASPADPAPGKNLPQTAPVTPLLKVSLAGTEPHNVFSGVKPQFVLTAQNWRPASATARRNRWMARCALNCRPRGTRQRPKSKSKP